MSREIIHLQKRLYLMAALVLLLGLAASVVIYLTAENDPETALGYTIVDGQSYPIMPEDSRMYRHDLQVYGGKYSVAADDFLRWFSSLWHGQTLAFTITVITLLISLGLFFAAKTTPPDPKH